MHPSKERRCHAEGRLNVIDFVLDDVVGSACTFRGAQDVLGLNTVARSLGIRRSAWTPYCSARITRWEVELRFA